MASDSVVWAPGQEQECDEDESGKTHVLGTGAETCLYCRDYLCGLAHGRASRNAEVAQLRAALDEAQTFIRSAAPLSWAAGSSLEHHAYAWEKESTQVLRQIDTALAASEKS